ncbi:xanthine dehydrogenase, molybdenum binding subunit apoprotein [Nannocystis exedens]|uniref:Xanthine dehydrogenase, molybdenum binding subunit apoprotein n=1 Tax=Nannocystis exedens TaxID=54 RepID=A0A1I2C504_9BACT|nr:xanthine dehydrogenase molybdopterin binding subunit [Nannocystis exedens]PCC71083.1 aldehyde oxidase [Nannocystis exedens]SFE62893.1 xanthine dehydrogenase, molybdenum binding subunit apoprotein [Nannocystis exedens]
MTEVSQSPLRRPAVHESAQGHVTGSARYVDDLPEPAGMLHGLPVGSPVARGRLVARRAERALALPGVRAVLFAADVPGHNRIGPIVHDEPLLAEDEVFAEGQVVALVLGDSVAACRAGARALELEFEELPAILTVAEALQAGSLLAPPHEMRRGDVAAAMARAAVIVAGELHTGGQDHFYLETHATLATPGENDTLHLESSTQHPTEVQLACAEVLGCARNQIVVSVPRMGGAFGGKESQASQFAALAALGARHTGRPVKVWLSRDLDMTMTGKRHPFWSRYRAGLDARGRLLALEVELVADGGWSVDLSPAILDRGMFHLDNGYFVPNLHFVGKAVRTNKASNTAFRGFGGPQGMAVIEEVLSRAAERLGLDPAEIRRRNYYGDCPDEHGPENMVDVPVPDGERTSAGASVISLVRARCLTPYYQEVPHCRLPRIHAELLARCDWDARRAEIAAWNARSPWQKRGLGFMPVKFGISFTNTMLNQAGALVLVYADGSVQLNHGGTEMGQGLHTKMLAVCAHELGVTTAQIRCMATATDKVPNTSATAASSGSDLNGMAVQAACAEIRERVRPVAAELLGAAPEAVQFVGGGAVGPDGRRVPWSELAKTAWMRRISLSAAGYYATPNIAYDRSAGRGKPFHYFAYGAAAVEVEVSGLTGEHRILRVDILHDVGSSLLPTIDLGQIEGGFIQGVGWVTGEELVWDAKGRLLTHGPSTYKIPAIGDCPAIFNVALLERAEQDSTIHGSKAVGEPPLMLGLGVVSALRQAIAAFGPGEVELGIPCTPEAILRAVVRQRTAAATRAADAAE